MRQFQTHPVHGIAGLRLVDAEEPTPGPGQLLVAVRACSLNYRDLVIAGNPKLATAGRVPLSDAAGEVKAVGEGVTEFAAGDRVAGNFFQGWVDGGIMASTFASALGGSVDGVLSQYVLFNADCTVKIPNFLSFEAAACLPCAAVTAWNALVEVGQARPGESVLLLGTGGVSIFGLQVAQLLGLRSIITSSSDDKLQSARKLGADEIINYRTEPEWEAVVRDMTGGEGVDHVLEVGGAGTLPRSLRAVKVGGTVQLIGVLSGANEINPMPVLHKVLNLRGVYVGSTRMFRDMLRAMEVHQVQPIIDRAFAFEEAQAAMDYLESGAHFGKVVIHGPRP